MTGQEKETLSQYSKALPTRRAPLGKGVLETFISWASYVSVLFSHSLKQGHMSVLLTNTSHPPAQGLEHIGTNISSHIMLFLRVPSLPHFLSQSLAE